MSIRRLKTLVTISKTGSFGNAARELYLCRSAVSLQMKALEEELQVTLFDRTKRPPTLNEAGKALVPKARKIVTAYEAMVADANENTALSGELSIGAMPTSMAGIIPGAINAMREQYPHLHITAFPENSTVLLPMVDRGEVDAAIISEPSYVNRDLEYRAFAEEPFIVLTPLDCPLDDPFEILRTMPFIRYSRALWAGQWIDDWLVQQRIHVNQTMELDNFETIASMVYHDLGISIIPLQCIPSPNPWPLKRLSVGPDAPKRVIGLLVRRDNPRTRLIDILYEQIVRLVQSQRPLEATPYTAH